MISPRTATKGIALVLVSVILVFSVAWPTVLQAGQRQGVDQNQSEGIVKSDLARPIVAAFSWDRITEFLRQSIGSKRRMIQVATIAVCIGLFIMFRSRR